MRESSPPRFKNESDPSSSHEKKEETPAEEIIRLMRIPEEKLERYNLEDIVFGKIQRRVARKALGLPVSASNERFLNTYENFVNRNDNSAESEQKDLEISGDDLRYMFKEWKRCDRNERMDTSSRVIPDNISEVLGVSFSDSDEEKRSALKAAVNTVARKALGLPSQASLIDVVRAYDEKGGVPLEEEMREAKYNLREAKEAVKRYEKVRELFTSLRDDFRELSKNERLDNFFSDNVYLNPERMSRGCAGSVEKYKSLAANIKNKDDSELKKIEDQDYASTSNIISNTEILNVFRFLQFGEKYAKHSDDPEIRQLSERSRDIAKHFKELRDFLETELDVHIDEGNEFLSHDDKRAKQDFNSPLFSSKEVRNLMRKTKKNIQLKNIEDDEHTIADICCLGLTCPRFPKLSQKKKYWCMETWD